MAKVTIGFGIVLVLVGVISYLMTQGTSLTALIPSAFGILLIILGAMALNEKFRKHAMHGAAVVGLVGFLGSASGLATLFSMMSGTTVEQPAAAIVRSVMALVCASFVALTVRSFIEARRARATE
jgi:uncharacterized membrane protein HdeD (DUF308 family)